MRREQPPPPGFWKTVGLLLRSARVRSVGRRDRQRQLLHNKTKKSGRSALSLLGMLGAVFIGLLIHGSAGFLVYMAVHVSQRYEAESQGKIVVSNSLMDEVRSAAPDVLKHRIEREAEQSAEHYGGRQK